MKEKMRIALVHNPRSGRNRRRPLDLDHLTREFPDLVPLRLEDGITPEVAAAELAARGVDLAVVSGGDGTLQKLLTALVATAGEGRLPAFAVVPRGTANMTASDLGLRRGDEESLRALLATARDRPAALEQIARPVLEIDYADNLPAACGLFFGVGAICDAIEFWRARFHDRGLAGAGSQLLTLGTLLMRAGTGGAQAAGLHCFDAELEIDGAAPEQRTLLLAIATTLDRLILRSRPFWNQNGAPLRFTAIEWPAEALVRSAPRILYGRSERRLPASYRSLGAQRIRLAGATRFVVDGEFYRPENGRPIILRAQRKVRFVRGPL